MDSETDGIGGVGGWWIEPWGPIFAGFETSRVGVLESEL